MSDIDELSNIERIVGTKRRPHLHIGRVVPSTQIIYILHSQDCINEWLRGGIDPRDCSFESALNKGIVEKEWEGMEDKPVVLRVDDMGYLGVSRRGTRRYLGDKP